MRVFRTNDGYTLYDDGRLPTYVPGHPQYHSVWTNSADREDATETWDASEQAPHLPVEYGTDIALDGVLIESPMGGGASVRWFKDGIETASAWASSVDPWGQPHPRCSLTTED